MTRLRIRERNVSMIRHQAELGILHALLNSVAISVVCLVLTLPRVRKSLKALPGCTRVDSK